MIGIIDYGLGNINAFCNVYKRLNIPAVTVQTPAQLAECSHLILPGVGAFDDAMKRLDTSGLWEPLEKRVLNDSIPVLGICVGMQMLAESSEEGVLPGLRWIPGKVRRFDPETIKGKPKLPHMGWNNVEMNNIPLFKNVEQNSRFYFIHSYYFAPEHPENLIASSFYGIPFASAINRGRIFGIQFHPEKSHHAGIMVLKNFAEL